MKIEIRYAKLEDATRLVEIYRYYVEKTAITFEYKVPSIEEFQQRMIHVMEKYPYLVAKVDDQIVGYAYAGAFHARPAYDWAVETSIYVSELQKGEGIGKALYKALEEQLSRQHILNLNACIAYPETEDEHLNKDSVRFHTHLGYRMVGEFYQCGYKFDRWYNMVWMEKHIGCHLENQPPVKPFEEVRPLLEIR